ncbi:DUF7450 family protein [Rubripirellula reticaptiva]|uniref:DUF7450 domain-containing protein n=1 Tax=Rubripirellula reticaptiva TaxID=2528013 RepID=A0A5C6F5I8_9BACT|nr:hypothetical protein [Rubripirellula reticaptiva]TWU56262.1 hypothetical protein Poly59_25660 [Rubripirellula reticaptiva]
MNIRFLVAVVCMAVGAPATPGFAHVPAEFLEVFSVHAALPVDHDVDLKTAVDQARRESKVTGPTYFAHSTAAMGRSSGETPAFTNWYAIVDPVDQPRRSVSVLDLVRGSKEKMLTLGKAEFLLCPSQSITTGAPAPIPDGLDFYKAYRVVDGPKVSMAVSVGGSGSSQRQLGKPLYVCIATQQWHHEATVTPSHPRDCFVVYELDEVKAESTVSTIDQFGLNELRRTKSVWLCVHGAILTKLVD